MSKNTSFAVGLTHGLRGFTEFYAPGKRTASKVDYDNGFQHGMKLTHERGAAERARLAQLNITKSQRV